MIGDAQKQAFAATGGAREKNVEAFAFSFVARRSPADADRVNRQRAEVEVNDCELVAQDERIQLRFGARKFAEFVVEDE